MLVSRLLLRLLESPLSCLLFGLLALRAAVRSRPCLDCWVPLGLFQGSDRPGPHHAAAFHPSFVFFVFLCPFSHVSLYFQLSRFFLGISLRSFPYLLSSLQMRVSVSPLSLSLLSSSCSGDNHVVQYPEQLLAPLMLGGMWSSQVHDLLLLLPCRFPDVPVNGFEKGPWRYVGIPTQFQERNTAYKKAVGQIHCVPDTYQCQTCLSQLDALKTVLKHSFTE